ncbi:hypothetical protein [Streptomyces sp. NPDC005953]|uniref:hypothetical protein n=1 Tax=Streptomyces sp. NPDC005953 TaxID=3156719 RepID=UPI0033EDBE8B
MATQPRPRPVLETYHNVSEAAVRLNLRKPEDTSKKGEKWLRDGVNKSGFPHTRLAGQLMFSDSHLATIAEMHQNAPQARGRHKRRTTRKPVLAAATA